MSQNTRHKDLLSAHPFKVWTMILLILWVLCIRVHAQDNDKPQLFSGSDFQIVTHSVEKSGALNGHPLYMLSYGFDFHNRDKIFLEEFGNIEPSGELSYLSPSKVVEFWSRDRKEKLATVEFQETGASRSGETDEMPPLKDFSTSKRTSPWPKNLPAKLNILKVINGHYPRGARAWIENDSQYFETLYEPLGSLPRGILGQVALLISFPNIPNSDPYSIDVRAAVRERRRLEDWRDNDISPQTESTADRFVALFAADLERAAGSQ